MGTCFYFQQGILETEQKGCMTMCGIVGYIGTEQAAPIILDGLSKLEYRGYDSAGMAILTVRRSTPERQWEDLRFWRT